MADDLNERRERPGAETGAEPVRDRIAIADREVEYACHLMEYLLQETGGMYDVRIYTSDGMLAEMAAEGAESGRTALLIISESMQMPEGDFPAVLVLYESGTLPPGDIPGISKYQSAQNILRYIRSAGLLQHAQAAERSRHGTDMKRIGVYSPVSRALKTRFSLALGQILAEEGKVLYMNFEAFPGIEGLCGMRPQGSVSDLLYYNECAKEKVLQALPGMLLSAGSVDIIPPVRSYMDLQGVRAGQWLALIRSISQGTDYDTLIMDLTEHTDGLPDMLRECGTVYTVTRGDPVSAARLEEYRDLLAAGGYQDVWGKTIRFSLPLFPDLPQDITMLRHSALGAFIRQLLEEQTGGTM